MTYLVFELTCYELVFKFFKFKLRDEVKVKYFKFKLRVRF